MLFVTSFLLKTVGVGFSKNWCNWNSRMVLHVCMYCSCSTWPIL